MTTVDPWNFNGEPATTERAQSSVTLVEGSSFSIASATGDIEPGGAEGLFFEDTRFVSTWRLRLDGTRPQGLAVVPHQPFAATFVSRGWPRKGEADSTLLVVRYRSVDNGMREDIVVQNLGQETLECTVELELAADFAHLFEVKENRAPRQRTATVQVSGSVMSFACATGTLRRRLEVAFPAGAQLAPGVARLDLTVAPGRPWRSSLEFHLFVDDEPIELRYRQGDRSRRSAPAEQLRAWRQAATRVRSDDRGVNATFLRSEQDMGALRIVDPEHPDRSVIAAGAPWFMTLFGRDSLIASLMTLGLDPDLATNTLRTLARMQGARFDSAAEEEPGKILHEMRRGLTAAADTRAGSVYYGSIDSTPLFVATLGAIHRWGAPEAVVAELLPHADRALEWIEQSGDRDGDGFVEYERATPRGLMNQGWKDSFDGVSFADGTLATAPIALCEVQGYVYAAYVARKEIAESLGDARTAERYASLAARLKLAFNEAFWLEHEGYFAIGLDREKRPIDSITSNVGHCLWSGIVDPGKARRVADRLSSAEMSTGWGIRTLASSMRRYNPVSYHNGSVWPHDSAICAAGLARYGFLDEAQAVSAAVFRTAEAFGGRLPELLCGFDREEFPVPIPYPASCSPQAWASASPFFLLQTTLLRFEPDLAQGVVACSPLVPPSFGNLLVENLRLRDARLSIDAGAAGSHVRGLPGGVRFVDSAAPPVPPP